MNAGLTLGKRKERWSWHVVLYTLGVRQSPPLPSHRHLPLPSPLVSLSRHLTMPPSDVAAFLSHGQTLVKSAYKQRKQLLEVSCYENDIFL